MITYDKLIEIVNSHYDVKIARRGRGLHMIDRPDPVSITEPEFHFLRQYVADKKLRRGFEVATAFGISALAAGLGFRDTGGQLVSIDSYIEEAFGDSGGYTGQEPLPVHYPEGYRLARFLRGHFGVPIHLLQGWSPDYTGYFLTRVYGRRPQIDYVFIDALHTDEAFQADVHGVLPFLSKERFALFLHDEHCLSDASRDFLVRHFGKSYRRIFDDSVENYGLSVVEVGL